MKKIESKIVGYSVSSGEEAQIVTEDMERPDMLIGATYKVKTPLSEHALYVTINDIVLNEGTGQEERRPFEIFINSKAMGHFQWIVALTRVLSAIFRKGGEITFLIEELKSVFDPKGGYFKKRQYIPSLIAEIGGVIEDHLQIIGIIPCPEIVPRETDLDDDKSPASENDFLAFCPKCQQRTLKQEGGCETCLSCDYSRCG